MSTETPRQRQRRKWLMLVDTWQDLVLRQHAKPAWLTCSGSDVRSVICINMRTHIAG